MTIILGKDNVNTLDLDQVNEKGMMIFATSSRRCLELVIVSWATENLSKIYAKFDVMLSH